MILKDKYIMPGSMSLILFFSITIVSEGTNIVHSILFPDKKIFVPMNMSALFHGNLALYLFIFFLITAQSIIIVLLLRSRSWHRRLEKALLVSEERYKNLIEDINEGVLILDLNGFIIFTCNVINKRNSYMNGKIIGSHFSDLIHPDDVELATQKFNECLQKSVKPYVIRIFDNDGKILYLRTTVRKKTDNGIVTGATVLMVDISDIKAQEQMLIDARTEAEEANSIKYRFLANISHELRTPLNAILGMSELLFEMEKSESKRGLIAIIKSSGNSLLTIINDILNFSKIDRCAFADSTEVFSLNRIMDDAAGLFKIEMAMKEIIFYREIDSLLPEYYRGDHRSIRQIFVNLISNAVKFTDSGSIRLSVFSSLRDGNRIKVIIEVEDSGIGIPDSEKDRIFRNFYQTDSREGRIYPGTGLGLAITKKIVEMMNGSISVKNAKRKGSIFRVEVELFIADHGFSDTFVNDDTDIEYPVSKRILLVEDNITNQTLTKIFLEKMDFAVETASNGLEAVDMIKKNRFDAVLMDCQMPVMDGYEASEEIRKQDENKAVPIIALTAYAFEEDRKKCLSSGMNDFITKPVSRTILYNTLRKWI